MEQIDAEKLVSAAVQAAMEVCVTGIEEKLQEAINLGVTIGAKVGAEVGSAAAAKAIEEERRSYRKQQYDWKYQNTKLLLRNYRRLNTYYKNAVFDIESAEEEDEDFESLMRSVGQTKDEAIFVESIQKNYITTKIIMTHVNKMLVCYEIMCKRSNRKEDKRRWRVLEELYISGDYTTAAKIAKKENIDKRTVYRDIDVCVADLTALFFGVGGIRD